jgi:hypothetical protein
MFFVLSYDTGYKHIIRLHCFTESEHTAKECYHAVCDQYVDNLVECLKIKGTVNHIDGYPIFWDNFRTNYEGVTLILSNNRDRL